MNILVTGGLGLIGHNVVKRLQDQGHLVSIMDTKTNYGIIPQDEIDYLMAERRKKIAVDSYIYDKDICDAKVVDHVFNVELYVPTATVFPLFANATYLFFP